MDPVTELTWIWVSSFDLIVAAASDLGRLLNGSCVFGMLLQGVLTFAVQMAVRLQKSFQGWCKHTVPDKLQGIKLSSPVDR